MGLLDVLTGMRNGPRGGSSGGGGMSPITMAFLGLLAYKAVKGSHPLQIRRRRARRASPARRRPVPAEAWAIFSTGWGWETVRSHAGWGRAASAAS